MSLAAYAAERGATPRTCSVCLLPKEVREQVEANEVLPREQRLPRAVVIDWLSDEHGVFLSPDALYRHNRNHITRDLND